MSNYQDKTLNCLDCNSAFTFSADDQQYHAEKGFTNEPKRCPLCRASRRTSGGGSSSYSSGYGSSNGGSSYGSGYSRQREMHSAVCAQCGKQAQVPFLPRGDRPVYCSDCFSKQPAAATRRY